MIPEGPHFIHTSTSGTDRMGFFVWLQSKQTIVRTFDNKFDFLIPLENEDEIQRYQTAVKSHDFDSNLGVYPLNQYAKWKKLTDFITKHTIDRLSPINDGKVLKPKTKTKHVFFCFSFCAKSQFLFVLVCLLLYFVCHCCAKKK